MSEVTVKTDTPLLRDFPPLFKNRNFLLLWAGYVISALGDRIHFLVMLKLLEKAHLAVNAAHQMGSQETAQLNIMMLLPFLFLGPITGVIADRLPRRLVMIGADFARVAVVVVARTLFLAIPANSPLHQAIPWLSYIPSYAILLLLASELIIAIFSAFFSPARTALLPNLVHPDQLLRANSMTNAAGTIASLVGFILGAALVSWHLEVAMYIDAGTFACSGVLLMLMTKTASTTGPAVSKEQRRGMFSEFADGVRYVLQHKRAMQVIFLMFLFWCAGAIILSGLTGVVTKRYHKDVEWFGYFLGYVGIGMMLGAASTSLARRGIAKEIGIAWSMVFVGIFFFLFSIPDNWKIALTFLIICAFFGAVLLVSLDTLLQRIVPDFVRGRVMAARDMVANVAMVGVAVAIALWPAVDDYIVIVLQVLAVLIIAVGTWLVCYYYRSQYLGVRLSILVRFVRAYLAAFKHFERGNAARIPISGPVIFVANHTTAYDPILMQASSTHRVIQFMMAKEYYEMKPFNFFYKWMKVIPVNRSGNDTASIRTAIRALKEGACIGMFPEGKISEDGRMNEGRPGVSLLALMSHATVVPAYIRGTNVHRGMVGDFLARGHVTIFFGKPMRFDDLKGHGEEARDEATRRIMGAIRGLREKYETDPERRYDSPKAKGGEEVPDKVTS
jgi:1-acyl-sn-glycerol-3-phosphate acyltransferase